MSATTGTEGYREAAHHFFELADNISFDDVHRPVLHLLPAKHSRVLDVGAMRPPLRRWGTVSSPSSRPMSCAKARARLMRPHKSNGLTTACLFYPSCENAGMHLISSC